MPATSCARRDRRSRSCSPSDPDFRITLIRRQERRARSRSRTTASAWAARSSSTISAPSPDPAPAPSSRGLSRRGGRLGADRPVRRRLLLRLHRRRFGRGHRPGRRGQTEAWRWTSDGRATSPSSRRRSTRAPKRGTRVLLHLKDDAKTYSEQATIERVVRGLLRPCADPDHAPARRRRSRQDARRRQRHLARSRRRHVTEAEYKRILRPCQRHQYDEPALTIHYRAEGRHEYSVLLFVPSMKPFDLFDPERRGRIKLYVKRVFITDDARDPARLAALRARRDRFRRPAAQPVARDAAEQSDARRRSARASPTASSPSSSKLARGRPASLRQGLGGLRAGDQGRALRGRRAPRRALRDRALPHHDAAAMPGGASPTMSPRSAEPDGDLLCARRRARRRSAPARSSKASQARGVEVLLLSDPVDAFWVRTALGLTASPSSR